MRATSRAGRPRPRPAPAVSTATDAPERNTRDRARARRARRSRSRGGPRAPDRTCRRTRRRASLLFRPLAPFHLEAADANRVALLRPERSQLAFDAAPDQLALKIRRRVRRIPVDARGEPFHAIALDPES